MVFPTSKIILQAGTALAVVGFVTTVLPSHHAGAQSARPMSAQIQTADPPARAGRLARTIGAVSFHAEGAERWDLALVNYPVTNGYSFWAEPLAQADIEISASRLVMDGTTELDINVIDERSVTTTLAQGQLYLRLRGLTADESYSVQTPRGTVMLRADGRYLITAGDTGNPSRVIVLQGRAQVGGADFRLDLAANQAAMIEGTSRFTVRMTAIPQDRFLQAQLEREQSFERQAVVAPALVRSMPGGDQLAAHGSWQNSQQYGQIWYPRVEANWQPYRDGRWVWVQPWGWTWVDNAPWGFAPSHYGRWVRIGGRWAWSPGVRESHGAQGRPVYAPAMVSFLDVGSAIGVGVGVAAASVAWVPLGYNEPYRPWYRVSDTYVRNVNVTNVTNVNNVRIENNTVTNVTINNFANRSAAVAAPRTALVTSSDVAQIARPVDLGTVSQARVAVGQPPVAPVATTPGVTPLVARSLNLEPARPDVAPAAIGQGGGPRLDRPRGERRGQPPLATPAADRLQGAVPAGSPTPGTAPATPSAPPSAAGAAPAGAAPTGAVGQQPAPGTSAPATLVPAPSVPGSGGLANPPSTTGTPPATERGLPGQRPDGQDRRGGGPVPAVPGTTPADVRPPLTPPGAATPSPNPGRGSILRGPDSSDRPAGVAPSMTGTPPATERGLPRQRPDEQDRRSGRLPPPGNGPVPAGPASQEPARSQPDRPSGVGQPR